MIGSNAIHPGNSSLFISGSDMRADGLSGRFSGVDGARASQQLQHGDPAIGAARPPDRDGQRADNGSAADARADGGARQPASSGDGFPAQAADLLPTVSLPKGGGAIRG